MSNKRLKSRRLVKSRKNEISSHYALKPRPPIPTIVVSKNSSVESDAEVNSSKCKAWEVEPESEKSHLRSHSRARTYNIVKGSRRSQQSSISNAHNVSEIDSADITTQVQTVIGGDNEDDNADNEIEMDYLTPETYLVEDDEVASTADHSVLAPSTTTRYHKNRNTRRMSRDVTEHGSRQHERTMDVTENYNKTGTSSESLRLLRKEETFIVSGRKTSSTRDLSFQEDLKRRKAMALAKANARHVFKNFKGNQFYHKDNEDHYNFNRQRADQVKPEKSTSYMVNTGVQVKNDRGENIFFHWRENKDPAKNHSRGPSALRHLYQYKKKRLKPKYNPFPLVSKSAPNNADDKSPDQNRSQTAIVSPDADRLKGKHLTGRMKARKNTAGKSCVKPRLKVLQAFTGNEHTYRRGKKNEHADECLLKVSSSATDRLETVHQKTREEISPDSDKENVLVDNTHLENLPSNGGSKKPASTSSPPAAICIHPVAIHKSLHLPPSSPERRVSQPGVPSKNDCSDRKVPEDNEQSKLPTVSTFKEGEQLKYNDPSLQVQTSHSGKPPATLEFETGSQQPKSMTHHYDDDDDDDDVIAGERMRQASTVFPVHLIANPNNQSTPQGMGKTNEADACRGSTETSDRTRDITEKGLTLDPGHFFKNNTRGVAQERVNSVDLTHLKTPEKNEAILKRFTNVNVAESRGVKITKIVPPDSVENKMEIRFQMENRNNKIGPADSADEKAEISQQIERGNDKAVLSPLALEDHGANGSISKNVSPSSDNNFSCREEKNEKDPGSVIYSENQHAKIKSRDQSSKINSPNPTKIESGRRYQDGSQAVRAENQHINVTDDDDDDQYSVNKTTKGSDDQYSVNRTTKSGDNQYSVNKTVESGDYQYSVNRTFKSAVLSTGHEGGSHWNPTLVLGETFHSQPPTQESETRGRLSQAADAGVAMTTQVINRYSNRPDDRRKHATCMSNVPSHSRTTHICSEHGGDNKPNYADASSSRNEADSTKKHGRNVSERLSTQDNENRFRNAEIQNLKGIDATNADTAVNIKHAHKRLSPNLIEINDAIEGDSLLLSTNRFENSIVLPSGPSSKKKPVVLQNPSGSTLKDVSNTKSNPTLTIKVAAARSGPVAAEKDGDRQEENIPTGNSAGMNSLISTNSLAQFAEGKEKKRRAENASPNAPHDRSIIASAIIDDGIRWSVAPAERHNENGRSVNYPKHVREKNAGNVAKATSGGKDVAGCHGQKLGNSLSRKNEFVNRKQDTSSVLSEVPSETVSTSSVKCAVQVAIFHARQERDASDKIYEINCQRPPELVDSKKQPEILKYHTEKYKSFSKYPRKDKKTILNMYTQNLELRETSMKMEAGVATAQNISVLRLEQKSDFPSSDPKTKVPGPVNERHPANENNINIDHPPISEAIDTQGDADGNTLAKSGLVRPKTAGLSAYSQCESEELWSVNTEEEEEDDHIQFIEGEQDFYKVFGYDEDTAAIMMATRVYPVSQSVNYSENSGTTASVFDSNKTDKGEDKKMNDSTSTSNTNDLNKKIARKVNTSSQELWTVGKRVSDSNRDLTDCVPEHQNVYRKPNTTDHGSFASKPAGEKLTVKGHVDTGGNDTSYAGRKIDHGKYGIKTEKAGTHSKTTFQHGKNQTSKSTDMQRFDQKQPDLVSTGSRPLPKLVYGSTRTQPQHPPLSPTAAGTSTLLSDRQSKGHQQKDRRRIHSEADIEKSNVDPNQLHTSSDSLSDTMFSSGGESIVLATDRTSNKNTGHRFSNRNRHLNQNTASESSNKNRKSQPQHLVEQHAHRFSEVTESRGAKTRDASRSMQYKNDSVHRKDGMTFNPYTQAADRIMSRFSDTENSISNRNGNNSSGDLNLNQHLTSNYTKNVNIVYGTNMNLTSNHAQATANANRLTGSPSRRMSHPVDRRITHGQQGTSILEPRPRKLKPIMPHEPELGHKQQFTSGLK